MWEGLVGPLGRAREYRARTLTHLISSQPDLQNPNHIDSRLSTILLFYYSTRFYLLNKSNSVCLPDRAKERS